MKKLVLISLVTCSISVFTASAQSNFAGSGIALQVNRSAGNYVDLGDVYNSLAFPFTFEAWVNIQAYSSTVYGGLFSSDNDLTSYRGIYISYDASAHIRIEFGNGRGNGYQYRRGYYTTSSVTLNKWTHVAIEASSMNIVHIYFNGVEQPIAPTDGGSTTSKIIHSNAPASIGKTQDMFAEHDMNGIIDEVRLWSTNRSEKDIRDFMCKKVDPNAAGLIGYWTADESYSSATVNDNSITGADGTIDGSVPKITSGAAIGDESSYTYTSDWTNVKVIEQDASGDKMTAKSITGNPAGVQVYRVDAPPYNTDGLNLAPSFYFGIFCAEGTDAAGYKAVYNFTLNNGVVTVDNQNFVDLDGKTDGSSTSWSILDSHTNATNKTRKADQSTRGEYIINVAPSEKLAENNNDNSLAMYPNPANQLITVSFSDPQKEIGEVEVVNIYGQVLKTIYSPNSENLISVNVSDLESGIYFIQVLTQNGWQKKEIEIQH